MEKVDFVQNAKDILLATLDTMVALANKWNDAQCNSTKIGTERLREMENECKDGFIDAQRTSVKAFKAMADKYEETIQKAMELDGGQVDPDAQLLSVLDDMEPEQFQALVQKHHGNPTMELALYQFARGNEKLEAVAPMPASMKAENYRRFIGACQGVIAAQSLGGTVGTSHGTGYAGALIVDGFYDPVGVEPVLSIGDQLLHPNVKAY